MGVYLQRQWHLPVPGPNTLPPPMPYKRPSAENEHVRRLAAVRKAQQGRAGGGGGGQQ
jgi:hypothetical protein